MDICLIALCIILIIVIIALLVKIHLMRKTADEISREFAEKLKTDTNTLIDISSRDACMRRLAVQINDQLKILRKERRRFLKGDRELKEAVTNIAHDLRTPLTAICGYLDLLKREDKSENMVRYLDMIENRTAVLKQLTEELFRYSVVVSGSISTGVQEVVLNDALEEAIAAYYGALKKQNINPEIEIPDKPVIRTLNPKALSRVFGNIITNAVKYSDGDLKVTLEENGRITFSNRAERLDAVMAGRLFDRFYTVDNGRGSTGLGLSIAKSLTEQMGGAITARYEDGRLYVEMYAGDLAGNDFGKTDKIK